MFRNSLLDLTVTRSRIDRRLILIALHDLRVQMLIENVNLRRRKLAGADLVLEQQVKLRKRATSGLGNTEIRIYKAEKADTGLIESHELARIRRCSMPELLAYPEETGEVSPVPRTRVEHIRGNDATDNGNNIAISY